MKTGTFEDFIASLSIKSGKKVILYIERGYDRLVNNYLSEHYDRLKELMAKAGNEFVYLPQWLKDSTLSEGLDYYVPNLPETDHYELIKDLYLHVSFAYNIGVSGSCFIRFSKDGKLAEYAYPVNAKLLYLDKLLGLDNEYQKLYNQSIDLSQVNELPDFYLPTVELANKRLDQMDLLLDKIDESPLFFEVEPDKEEIEPEVLLLTQEIAEKIQRLKMIGGMSFVVNILKAHLQPDQKISRLHIDADFRFWLVDYGNREIKFPPLSKIIYLLYLNHPEGIAFKELSDYRHELLELYKNISNRLDTDQLVMNVNRLIDPLDNSLNEKVSVIRLKIINELDESIAAPYLLTGEKGERRFIPIDRSLVSYHSSLNQLSQAL